MQKRKLFKLSVIMHTMSKATYDQNIFYTSDTDLALEFELIEKEYSYDSGEILLFNETDKSFVTRDINKVDSGFVYQIESDIIQHHGEWTGQLQLVKNGEVYTSKPFQFTIENDLSTVSPPQLIDINNWATLKQSAINLIDDMQIVIGEYDEAAISFQQAENNRMNNETDRIQAESTRENHETTRQNQERDREKNEIERKSNEVTRVENETVREQAEQERQSAELIRLENEEERVLTYENMQETIDMIGKVKLSNAFENGDFSNGTTNWMTIPGYLNRFEVVDGVAKNVEVSTENHRSFIYSNSKIPSGHITYHAFRYKQVGVVSSRIGVLYGLSGANLQQYYYPTGEDFKIYTGMGVGTDAKYMRLFITNIVNNGEYSIFLDYFFIIDLTATFGKGKEPGKEVMDWIINSNGYFDELSISRDDIQHYEINQLRNAIIALGGTI